MVRFLALSSCVRSYPHQAMAGTYYPDEGPPEVRVWDPKVSDYDERLRPRFIPTAANRHAQDLPFGSRATNAHNCSCLPVGVFGWQWQSLSTRGDDSRI